MDVEELGRVVDSVVVFAGGPRPGRRGVELVPEGALVVAADRGVEHAAVLGVRVDVVVGDFDSISPEALAAVEGAEVRVERHPAAKDATDLELALDVAIEFVPRRILVVGGAGGRLDHLLGELLLLGRAAYAGATLDAALGQALVHVIWGERFLSGASGELISLFALHGPAVGVVTEGLVYPLRGETLTPGSSRGVSNVFATGRAGVTLKGGVLLAVRPGEQEGTSAS